MNKKIVRISLALLFVSLLITAPRAQQTATQSKEDRVALYQALLDLTNPWTVMCIAAHPDDEDGTSLIVMRRKYGAHTVSLFTTFGEGGQNAIGPELYEEMGAIRVRETMAASEIQGSEPHFLGMKDFGFSKSAYEAFKFWGHDEALRRMVLQFRKLRPDVIITNHSATSNDHGHHQATARLELEAFDAAADPKRFPEQLKDGVTVWQVQRLFVRARGNAQAQTATAPAVTIDPNERDSIRETVYAEEALRALQKHATQGPWPKTFAEYANRFRAFTGQTGAPGQLPPIRYALVREAKGAAPITKDSHNFLDGLQLPGDVAKQLVVPMLDDRPLDDYVKRPEVILAALIDAQKRNVAESGAQMTAPFFDPRVVRHRQLLSAVMAAASGVTAKLVSNQDVSEPGSAASFRVELSNNGTAEVRLDTVLFGAGYTNGKVMLNPATSLKVGLAPGKTISTPISYQVPATAELTTPHARHLYDGRVNGYPVAVSVLSEIQNVRFEILRRNSIDISPKVEITEVTPSPLVITPQTANPVKALRLHIVNHSSVPLRSAFETIAEVNMAGDGLNTRIVGPTLMLNANEKREMAIADTAKITKLLQPNLQSARTAPKKTLRFRVGSNVPSEAVVPVIFADAHVASGLRVGYVRGFDFSLPHALAALGVESKELSVDEVKTADLQKYSSIIVDNRVYESKPELIAANQKLLDYANAGGTLVVFYHKSDEWNPDERRKRPQLAPYKLILGNERITDENAPITFLEPEHPLLNSPNKLGQEDFADWIQERGLYYPKEWDPQFHALLQSNDPGEAPLKGGLLVADYGRGHYIYSSMVWYRELRAGVPGAYRMLANMISYGHSR